ncbi:type II secretion system F family protein [Candidatus Woesearchaeota archaeon]|nr:type II secretion system F family protein [Candidatus Woesearchaeota archaeon]
MDKIGFVNRVASFYPKLKTELKIAHLPYTSIQYVNRSLKAVSLYSLLFTILFFFVLQKAKLSIAFLVPAFFVLFILLFQYSLLTIRAKIRKREREVNKEVLFVGRYLLVKLYSGRPLLNALIETAESRGIASKYIKEIVDDIGTGSTIEDALNNAMIYSPSDKLRRILFHINNALQLGINVTKPLESVLEEITREEELEIRKYGKKLNTLVIFYMLGAVILPSLGVALFIVVSSFINLSIGLEDLLIFTLFIVMLQFIFITLFKSIRPMVNL